MGVLSDLIASGRTFSASAAGNQRRIYSQLNDLLNELGDFDYPADCAATNEVQSIAKYGGTASAGAFTLTITKAGGTTVTTAPIAYNATATTINTALSTATIGDVVASGGPLTSGALVLTFSGTSVAASKPGLTTIAVNGLTGGTAGVVTVTTNGQSGRTAWAALKAFSIVTSSPPVQGVAPGSVTVGNGPEAFPHSLEESTVRAICKEAALADNQEGVETSLLTAIFG